MNDFYNTTPQMTIIKCVAFYIIALIIAWFFCAACWERRDSLAGVSPEIGDGVVGVVGEDFDVDHTAGIFQHASAIGRQVTKSQVLA